MKSRIPFVVMLLCVMTSLVLLNDSQRQNRLLVQTIQRQTAALTKADSALTYQDSVIAMQREAITGKFAHLPCKSSSLTYQLPPAVSASPKVQGPHIPVNGMIGLAPHTSQR